MMHFKIALTGCPNDCAKVRMHDFGIMGMTLPRLDPDRCVNCGACVKYCRRKSVEALETVNYRPKRNEEKCIGCGECVLNCPASAWTRDEKKYYRLTLLGRTGKRNPRLGEDFIKWADEDSIIKIILNTYKYVEHYIDRSAPGGKEHIGYIVDRTGFEEFKNGRLTAWNCRKSQRSPHLCIGKASTIQNNILHGINRAADNSKSLCKTPVVRKETAQ